MKSLFLEFYFFDDDDEEIFSINVDFMSGNIIL